MQYAPPRLVPFPTDRGIATWLFICAAAIFLMILIGGITRLTDSGLSMVEWRPVFGFLPPLSEAEWQRIFELYRQTPQYGRMFPDMTLAEFKGIFWWEYIHRIWGRLIGVIFLVPLLWFAVKGRINAALGRRLVAVFLLGGLQGLLGWYMVKSGLIDRPAVSQYRLTAHLGLALLLYGYLIWTGLNLTPRPPPVGADDPVTRKPLERQLMVLLGLIAATLLAGGFMAGTDAGRAYTTYPLMNGQLFPDGYFALAPWFANPFENVTAINFNHRWLGTLTALFAVHVWVKARRYGGPVAAIANFLVLVVALQFALGVATLTLAVPVQIAAAHQAGAVLLLTLAIWLLHGVRMG